MLYHLVAYRFTGKDTLFTSLKSDDVSSLGYKVYAEPSRPQLILPKTKIRRIALADKLKLIVCEKLNLNLTDSDEDEAIIQKFNEIKDTCVVNGYNLRKWCIIIGTQLTQEYGQTHLVDLVREDIKKSLKEGESIFMTDTRFPFEVFNDIKSTTIRIFRSIVPIPCECEGEHNGICIPTERSMDSYKCDYVLCKDEDEFEKLVKIQPQYAGFVMKHELV